MCVCQCSGSCQARRRASNGWGAIPFGWKFCHVVLDGNVTAQRYLDTILRIDVTPLFVNSPNYIIMQDNARPLAVGHQCQYSTLATLFTRHQPNRTRMGSSGSSDSETPASTSNTDAPSHCWREECISTAPDQSISDVHAA